MITYNNFNLSDITVVLDEDYGIISSEILFRLCAKSVIFHDRDVIFIDGYGIFNPYSLAKIAKSFRIKQDKLLTRIHVARAFTQFQIEELINRLQDAFDKWNPLLLAISYMASLFTDREEFEIQLRCIKSFSKSSNIITVMTSSKELDLNNIILKYADHIINSSDHIIDNRPYGQTSIADF